MESALPLARRQYSAHVALVVVAVLWAGAFSAIKALLEHGMAAGDIALQLVATDCLKWKRRIDQAARVGGEEFALLLPETGQGIADRTGGDEWTPDDLHNPELNIRYGSWYLRHLLDQNRGNLRQALIAYNQGLTSLRTYGAYGVAERYADRVLALRPQFRSA